MRSLTPGSIPAVMMSIRLYGARVTASVMAAALGFFLFLAQTAEVLVKGHTAEVFCADGLELFRFDQARPYLVISIIERDRGVKPLKRGTKVINGATLVAVGLLLVLAFGYALFAELDTWVSFDS
jgi:hypothetical protein